MEAKPCTNGGQEAWRCTLLAVAQLAAQPPGVRLPPGRMPCRPVHSRRGRASRARDSCHCKYARAILPAMQSRGAHYLNSQHDTVRPFRPWNRVLSVLNLMSVTPLLEGYMMLHRTCERGVTGVAWLAQGAVWDSCCFRLLRPGARAACGSWIRKPPPRCRAQTPSAASPPRLGMRCRGCHI